mmetsp:Transcript_31860/g.58545  ORF Transcript_31860/g.58545 Transcript_31860/m.58545 type:complete len:214 (+) Transcript_31860:64-705(+)
MYKSDATYQKCEEKMRIKISFSFPPNRTASLKDADEPPPQDRHPEHGVTGSPCKNPRRAAAPRRPAAPAGARPSPPGPRTTRGACRRSAGTRTCSRRACRRGWPGWSPWAGRPRRAGRSGGPGRPRRSRPGERPGVRCRRRRRWVRQRPAWRCGRPSRSQEHQIWSSPSPRGGAPRCAEDRSSRCPRSPFLRPSSEMQRNQLVESSRATRAHL